MTLNEYQSLANRTVNTKLTKEQLVQHSLHGMVSELGELHSLYQKVYQGHTLDETHLKKELGDLLWFISEFCTGNDWNLEDIAQLNIEKLRARFPEGFSTDRSLNRASTDI